MSYQSISICQIEDKSSAFQVLETQLIISNRGRLALDFPFEMLTRVRAVNVSNPSRTVPFNGLNDQTATDPIIPISSGPNTQKPTVFVGCARYFDNVGNLTTAQSR